MSKGTTFNTEAAYIFAAAIAIIVAVVIAIAIVGALMLKKR